MRGKEGTYVRPLNTHLGIMEGSRPIDGLRIEQAPGVDERQLHAAFASRALARLDLAIEAGLPPGVACGPDLLDLDPDHILIAIGTHLDHALGLTGGLAFAPQRVARAAEIPGLAAGDGL